MRRVSRRWAVGATLNGFRALAPRLVTSYKPTSMKINLLFTLKNITRARGKRVATKSNLTILLLLFVALAFAGCETMESASSGGFAAPSSPWAAASTGHSTSVASQIGFASGLGGQWYHDGKPTSIRVDPDGRNLMITDENGRRTSGVANSPYELEFGGLKGSVGHGGRRISWNNGTTWTREPHQDGSHSGASSRERGVSGRWYHDGKPTSVNMSLGGSVTITDENGKTSSGHMVGNGEFVMSSLIRGSVSPDGRRISWSNGTTWTR